MAREISSIGSSIYYNAREVDSLGHCFGNTTGDEIYEWEFDFNDLPQPSLVDAGVITLQAGDFIKSATLHVLTTMVTATTMDIGLIDPDGTAHDPDGFFDGEASITAGDSTVGTGSLVGTTLAKTGQLVFLGVGGTASAGRFKVRVVIERV